MWPQKLSESVGIFWPLRLICLVCIKAKPFVVRQCNLLEYESKKGKRSEKGRQGAVVYSKSPRVRSGSSKPARETGASERHSRQKRKLPKKGWK